MTTREVVSRTLFRKSQSNGEWYWSTKALNNQIIATGGEGYKDLKDAIRGFFVSQGVHLEDGQSLDDVDGYVGTQLSTAQFQINKFIKLQKVKNDNPNC